MTSSSRLRARHPLFGAALAAGASLALTASCSSSSNPTAPVASAEAGADAPDAGPVEIKLEAACGEAIDAIYADPGALPADKGAIIKCAIDRAWSKDELERFSRANKYAYTGKPFTSGAKTFRVVYRTERGDPQSSPGYSSALVFVPDVPAAGAPAVVVAHGTAGQAPRCTPSKYPFESTDNSFAAMIFPLVGAGMPVIVPDYAGYAGYGAAGNPPSGYAMSPDVGKSVLDGARALRAMLTGVGDKTILVGHSQGGHSVLSALALSESYGVPLAGVVSYAPLWFNQATWGALFFVANQYPIADNAFAVGVGVWYHYSHAELINGQGKGVELFAPDKRAAIKEFFDTACGSETDKIKPLGTIATDLYEPAFASSVKLAAALGSPCGAGDAVCEKWKAIYAADRPHLTGAAAQVPQLVLYGTADTTIPADRAMCGFDWLRDDGAKATICVDSGQDHSGIGGARSAYVNDWIANVAMGAPAPEPCAADETSLMAAGAKVTCATPPPND